MIEEGLFEVGGAEHGGDLGRDRSSLKQFALGGGVVAEEVALGGVFAKWIVFKLFDAYCMA